jgi:hypothetical protein
MIPAGYLAKKVAPRPDWLPVDSVVDLYSVSNCESEAFCDYTRHWKHNGYWLFNSPSDLNDVARSEGIDLGSCVLFYYEVYERQFDGQAMRWSSFDPVAGLETCVQPPREKALQGFDLVSFAAQSSHECSPLSCNGLARSITVNAHCLLASLDEAKSLLEQGQVQNCEPGPYRIYAVYRCDAQ